jgi:hypothetical protein
LGRSCLEGHGEGTGNGKKRLAGRGGQKNLGKISKSTETSLLNRCLESWRKVPPPMGYLVIRWSSVFHCRQQPDTISRFGKWVIGAACIKLHNLHNTQASMHGRKSLLHNQLPTTIDHKTPFPKNGYRPADCRALTIHAFWNQSLGRSRNSSCPPKCQFQRRR